jgi:hypothetical protein
VKPAVPAVVTVESFMTINSVSLNTKLFRLSILLSALKLRFNSTTAVPKTNSNLRWVKIRYVAVKIIFRYVYLESLLCQIMMNTVNAKFPKGRGNMWQKNSPEVLQIIHLHPLGWSWCHESIQAASWGFSWDWWMHTRLVYK